HHTTTTTHNTLSLHDALPISPDYQKDENGNRQLIYAKDALVTTVTTGEDGKAVADNLPLGSYYVVEKTAPEGFVLNHDRSEVALDRKSTRLNSSHVSISYAVF